MIAKLTITPESNVIGSSLADMHDIQVITRDWEDLVEVYSVPEHKQEKVAIARLSLYDHRLILEDQHHRVLHMFSFEPTTIS